MAWHDPSIAAQKYDGRRKEKALSSLGNFVLSQNNLTVAKFELECLKSTFCHHQLSGSWHEKEPTEPEEKVVFPPTQTRDWISGT